MLGIPDCALFTANVYGNSRAVRSVQNVLPIPDGWGKLNILPVSSTSTEFMARAYQSPHATEIVIAYAGTMDKDRSD